MKGDWVSIPHNKNRVVLHVLVKVKIMRVKYWYRDINKRKHRSKKVFYEKTYKHLVFGTKALAEMCFGC